LSVPAPEAGFVVDCSVSAAWLFEEQADDYTEAALDALASAPALAPGSWILEMLNALLMLERRRRLTASDAVQALRLLRRLPVHLQAAQAGPIELHALASRHQLTSYDAVYLNLALTSGLPLATRDKALARAATDCGVGVWAPDPGELTP
jgi:predicted nucleic acid-binding protein